MVKHNRNGRVMQMVVLLNNFDHAKELLDGNNCVASKFGAIQYYKDDIFTNYGFKLIDKYGIRTFFDLQQNQEIQKDIKWQESMIELEEKVSTIEDYYNIAFFHHLIFIKE